MAHIDSTYGGSGANAYISVDTAGEIFEERLYTTVWEDARTEQKERALVWATQLLDTHVDWHGSRQQSEELGQPLRWPRFGIYGPDGHWFDASKDSGGLPLAVQDAVAEMAQWLLEADPTAPPDDLGIKFLRVDVIQLEFDKADRDGSLGGVIPEKVKVLIDPVYGTVRPRNDFQARVIRT